MGEGALGVEEAGENNFRAHVIHHDKGSGSLACVVGALVVRRADVGEFRAAIVEVFDEVFVVILRRGGCRERCPVKGAVDHRRRWLVRNIDAEDFDFHRGEAVFEGLDFLLHAALFVFGEARLDEGVGGHRAHGGIPRGELDDVREFSEEIHRAVGDLGAVEVDLSELPERGEFGDILVVGVGFLEAEFLEVGKPGDHWERGFRDFGFARIE